MSKSDNAFTRILETKPFFNLINLIWDKSALLFMPLANKIAVDKFSSFVNSYIPGLFTPPEIETRFAIGLINTRSPDRNLVEKLDVPFIKVS